MQLNLLQLPTFEAKEGLKNFELHTKRLRDGQLVINLRHISD